MIVRIAAVSEAAGTVGVSGVIEVALAAEVDSGEIVVVFAAVLVAADSADSGAPSDSW